MDSKEPPTKFVKGSSGKQLFFKFQKIFLSIYFYPYFYHMSFYSMLATLIFILFSWNPIAHCSCITHIDISYILSRCSYLFLCIFVYFGHYACCGEYKIIKSGYNSVIYITHIFGGNKIPLDSIHWVGLHIMK